MRKTEHYIINPHTGDLNTLQEWKDYVAAHEGADIKDAECICIIPADGTPFAFPKNDIGKFDWGKAVEAVKTAVVPLPKEFMARYSTSIEASLPTRKHGIDIGDCNHALYEEPEVHLDDSLEAIGGTPFSGAYFWSSSRSGANLAWFFSGTNGFAYNYYMYASYRALPLVLCPGAKRP